MRARWPNRRIVPRAEHPLSRRDIDPDALKVLYRLRQAEHIAYLVGGSVRDLLLGRRPKDFDIGTSAHPYQVKKLFRNCWIIGRRFRLAHVKFGTKVIEVATFRRQVAPGEEIVAGRRAGARSDDARRRAPDSPRQHVRHARRRRVPPRLHDQRAVLRHRDVLGHRLRRRPRGSARRRRALDRRSRSADPRRSGAHAARRRARRRGSTSRSIRRSSTRSGRTGTRSRTSSPPRLLEEYYKILRAGIGGENVPLARRARAARADLGGAAPRRGDPLWHSLARARRVPQAVRVDARHADQPDSARQLLVPLGISLAASTSGRRRARQAKARASGAAGPSGSASCRSRAATSSGCGRSSVCSGACATLAASPRAQRALAHRHIFRDALTWLEIHGGAPDVVEHWKALLAEAPDVPDETAAQASSGRHRQRRRVEDAGAAADGVGGRRDPSAA